ncbi:MAG: UMP kinase [Thermoproteota archaeon]
MAAEAVACRKCVVKISGKIVSPESVELVRGYINVLKSLRQMGLSLAVVVGGGMVSRSYISALNQLGANKGLQDLIGIEASRLNARLLAYALYPEAYPEPPRSLWELLEVYSTGKLVITGGFQPGQSTSTVAALVAEAIGAEMLVLATTVDGVYTADPRADPSARMIKRLSYDELLSYVSSGREPGSYELLDPYAVEILKRSGIPSRVVNGLNPENVLRAVRGEDVGTLITPFPAHGRS